MFLLRATDCINGTLIDRNDLPEPFMNFTQFLQIYAKSDKVLDTDQKFLPNQLNITIYDWKKLFINLDGCVNTLRGECKEFVDKFGHDGDNNTAQSRYPCYYNKVSVKKFLNLKQVNFLQTHLAKVCRIRGSKT